MRERVQEHLQTLGVLIPEDQFDDVLREAEQSGFSHLEYLAERTGFDFTVAGPLPATPDPDPGHLRAIRDVDRSGLRERLIG